MKPFKYNYLLRFTLYFRLSLSILLTLLSFKVWSQQSFVLKGYIAIEGGESFTYRIECSDSMNIVRGFFYTISDEKNDVKAAISGVIDRENKTLSFKETAIVYNHNFHSKVSICLVSAVLKLKNVNNNTVLGGSITSKDIANAGCAGGSVTFTNEDVVKTIFTKEEKKEAAPLPAKQAVLTTSRPVPIRSQRPTQIAPAVPDEVTNGADKIYTWFSDTVLLDIWDGGKPDDDMVTILFNERPVLSKYILSNEKKQLLLILATQELNTITIIAENTGNEPPNTANLLLQDRNLKHDVIAYNERGKKAVIKLRKPKK